MPAGFPKHKEIRLTLRQPDLFLSICSGKAPFEVCKDIVNMLCADRQADGVRSDALIEQLLLGKLRVRGRRRMNDERFHIRDIRQQGEDLQRVDEPVCRRLSAFDLKGEDGRAAVGEIFLIQRVVGMLRQAGWFTFSTCGWLARNCTTFLVFSAWRSRRSESVSTPCRSRNAEIGAMHAPISRSKTARM